MLHRHLAPRRTYVSGFFGGGGPSSTCTYKSPNAAPRALTEMGRSSIDRYKDPYQISPSHQQATEAAQNQISKVSWGFRLIMDEVLTSICLAPVGPRTR